jgi:serine/threonine protein phosphatase PrpC
MEAFETNPATTLVRAVESANREVWRYAQRMGPSHRGMGCAFVAAQVLADRVEVVWAGDCRAVCRTPRTQYDMTQDHAQGHLLTRALGTREEIALSLSTLSRAGRPEGELLVALYTDGVWGQVPDATLHALFDQGLRRQLSLDHVAKRAVAHADRAGGVDNATIALAIV